MGKKSSPAQPKAPDPVATANAQAAANTTAAITQANLNRIDQYTPQGSLTYSQNGTNADGTPKYAQTQTLSPAEQQKYDQANQIATSLNGLAQANVGRVQEAQSKPFTYEGMTPLQTSVAAPNIQYSGGPSQPVQTGIQGAGGIQSGYNSGGAVQSSYGTGGPVQSGYASGGAVKTGYDAAGKAQGTVANAGAITNNIADAGKLQTAANGGNVQTALDYSKLGALPDSSGSGFDAAYKKASDASYGQATSRLDPQFQQQQSDLSARLVNSGISQGSEAYNREIDNFARSKNDAYNQANFSAQAFGLSAQNQGYNQQLSTRQQGVSEINNQGQFANSAQAQAFGQSLSNAQLNNSAQAQQYGQNANNAQFANSAQAQQYGQNANNVQIGNAAQAQNNQQNAQAAQFANSAQAQQNQQNAGAAQFGNAAQAQQNAQNQQAAQFGNTAQNQQNTQNAQAAQFGNAAQQQQYGQNANNAQFYNSGQAQQFDQGQQTMAGNNTAQNQQYNQSLQGVNLNNAARQQQIQEAAYLRNIPLNDIASLMSGSTVNNPQFQNVAQVGVAAPDYMGAAYNSFNAQNAQYNQAQANKSAALGSVFGLAGSAASMFSDARLKHNVKRVGELANGLATYVFSYIGDTARHFGVMAQEALNVVPEAVHVASNGYLMVDYRKVY